MDWPDSTLEEVTDDRKGRGATWARRGFLSLILLVVIAGLLGLLGTKTATATADGGGYHLSLEYARIARPGLDVPWKLTVTHRGGFDGPVRVELTTAYVDLLEQQGIFPNPSAETQDGHWWRMTFDRPAGDTLVIDFDVYIKPSRQHGASGEVRVLAPGAPGLSFSTWVLP